MTRSRIRMKIRWQDPGSRHVDIWLSLLQYVDKTRCGSCRLIIIIIFSRMSIRRDPGSCRLINLFYRTSIRRDPGSCRLINLFYRTSIRRDPGSCQLIIIFSRISRRRDLDLVIWSSLIQDDDMTRSGILSPDHNFSRMSIRRDPGSCRLIIISRMSKRRDPRSCRLIISSPGCR